ncbi:hypothetical protein TH62_06425 [Bacillus sp. TH008]|nr:hypothetical protein TH62_06425 [Bacillus sp. TH008]
MRLSAVLPLFGLERFIQLINGVDGVLPVFLSFRHIINIIVKRPIFKVNDIADAPGAILFFLNFPFCLFYTSFKFWLIVLLV